MKIYKRGVYCMKTWKYRAFSPLAVIGIVAIIALGLAFAGCKTEDGDGGGTTSTKPGPVAIVTLNKVELTLGVGDTETLTTSILPKRAVNKAVSWSSSDTAVATVTNGFVTGVAEGTARITVTTQDGGKQAVCVVTVVVPVAVTGVTLSNPTLSRGVGSGEILTAVIEPPNATNKKVSWSSSNTNVATVSTSGGVVAISQGTATITVKTNDGGFTASCVVTVTAASIGPITPPDIPGFVWIPAGTFTMGSSVSEPSRDPSMETPHSVTLNKGFYMGQYHITQGDYKEVMGYNPSEFNIESYYPEYMYEWPVDGVNWYAAVEYCNKKSTLDGLTPVYMISGRTPATGYPISAATVTCNWDADGYRLPTEAEWEYACRAGTETAFNFAEREWDDFWEEYGDETGTWGSNYIWLDWANYSGDQMYNGRLTSEGGNMWYGQTLPWSLFEDYPNKWGVYNMHGMLEEWCWDWLDEDGYESADVTDPRGLATGTFRALRGGSWEDPARWVRSAQRNGAQPQTSYFFDGWDYSDVLGFRVVRNYVPGSGSKIAAPKPSVNVRGGASMQELRTIRQGMQQRIQQGRIDKNFAPLKLKGTRSEIRALPQGIRIDSASPVRPEALRRKAVFE
jgi:formylglycine-generating enzyme required for sulfatase activity